MVLYFSMGLTSLYHTPSLPGVLNDSKEKDVKRETISVVP